MKSFYLILIFATGLFYSTVAYSQELLVNGSFEEENICTEFTKNCAPEGWICTSLISNYYFNVRFFGVDGEHFIGLIAANNRAPAKRSFIRSRLLCGLRKGSNYKLSFFVRSKHPVLDSLGVYFSEGDFLFEKKPFSQLTPSLMMRDSNNTESDRWEKMEFNYLANGNENFITIGSFRKKDIRFTNPPEIEGNYYFYIDSVSMVPADSKELLCGATDSMKAEIYAENERHKLLEKKIAYYRKSPPLITPAPVTELEIVDTLVIPDILFATASALLKPASTLVLDSFARAIAARQVDSLVINGHTDSVGTLVYNNNLSSARAKAVATFLTSKSGLDSQKVIVRFFAFTKPIASNQTEQGRRLNRRVEIFVYRRERTRK